MKNKINKKQIRTQKIKDLEKAARMHSSGEWFVLSGEGHLDDIPHDYKPYDPADNDRLMKRFNTIAEEELNKTNKENL